MGDPAAHRPDFTTYERQFIEFLRKKGLRYTPERRMVIQTVHEIEGHVQAEDILLALRQRGEGASKATIYRTIALLQESGLLQVMNFGQRHARFEAVLEGHEHDHIVCVNCDKVIEFADERLEQLWREICEKNGVTPVSHKLVIWGTCALPHGEE